jgi:hypothetical protein
MRPVHLVLPCLAVCASRCPSQVVGLFAVHGVLEHASKVRRNIADTLPAVANSVSRMVSPSALAAAALRDKPSAVMPAPLGYGNEGGVRIANLGSAVESSLICIHQLAAVGILGHDITEGSNRGGGGTLTIGGHTAHGTAERASI